MNMICRITDETVFNPWDNETDKTDETTTIHDLSVHDLMGEDMSVWVGKNKDFGYVMEIETEEGKTITEKCIHPYAMESMASFCRRFLSFYDKIEAE